MEAMTATMREQAIATTNLVNLVLRGSPRGSMSTNDHGDGNPNIRLFEFQKNNPTTFKGEYDPLVIELWL